MSPVPADAIGLRKDALALHVSETCVRCKRPIDGWLYVSRRLAIVDSVAFVLTGDGPTCDACMGRTSTGTIPGQ